MAYDYNTYRYFCRTANYTRPQIYRRSRQTGQTWRVYKKNAEPIREARKWEVSRVEGMVAGSTYSDTYYRWTELYPSWLKVPHGL